jgi:hypothetical protein
VRKNKHNQVPPFGRLLKVVEHINAPLTGHRQASLKVDQTLDQEQISSLNELNIKLEDFRELLKKAAR